MKSSLTLRNNSAAQRFILNPIEKTAAEGTYTVKSALNTAKAIDVQGGSLFNGANVQLYDSNGTDAQKIMLEYDAESGYYTCIVKCSSKALDVMWGMNANGTNVQQYDSNGTWAQKWAFVTDGQGYRIISASSGKALDVSGAQTYNGVNIQIYQNNATKAQEWILEAC